MSAVRNRKHLTDSSSFSDSTTNSDSTRTHDKHGKMYLTGSHAVTKVTSRSRSPSLSPGSNMVQEDVENDDSKNDLLKPLMIDEDKKSDRDIPLAVATAFADNSTTDSQQQAFKFAICFFGLQASYLTWGYMQELIMTTIFEPTPGSPDGKFPSAAFCVFSNRFLAVLVGAVACKIKHGALYANNVAPILSFAPCALSNTLSSWSQYASLKYVAFPVQTVFKSSKIIPVMMMGKFLKGSSYPLGQYVEAFLITVGVVIFSLTTKTAKENHDTQTIGLIFMVMYICCDSFTSQWQDKIYQQYGRSNVDQYQMMLCVNSCAIIITTTGLLISGDIPVVYEFLIKNPVALHYNIITAITSATGQFFIYKTIKEFGPIVFTIIMTTRQMFSITISCVIFGHKLGLKSLVGAALVFSVIFYQIRRKHLARIARQNSGGSGGS